LGFDLEISREQAANRRRSPKESAEKKAENKDRGRGSVEEVALPIRRQGSPAKNALRPRAVQDAGRVI